jgi:hypothetical protein
MRLTEILYFLNKNPKGEELLKFSYIDISSVKKEMKQNKELRRFVRESRKEKKEELKEWEEDIFVEKQIKKEENEKISYLGHL